MAISRPRLDTAATIFGVADESAYAERQAAFVAKKGRLQTDREGSVTAYVNGSRWVADCQHCGAGIAVHPEWTTARCFGCGSIYAAVVFPNDWQAVEDVLWARPTLAHNWQPEETVVDLALANEAIGLAGLTVLMAAKEQA